MTIHNDSPHYYHDDPIEYFEEEIPSSPWAKRITYSAIALVSSFFLYTTLAANVTINGNSSREFGQGFSSYAACSGSTALTMKPNAVYSSGSFLVQSVSVSNIPLSCVGNDFTMSAYGASVSPNGSMQVSRTSNQYIKATIPAPGSGSATYEWWFYSTESSMAANGGMFQTRAGTGGSGAQGFDISLQNGAITASTYGAWLNQNAGTVTYNAWHHFAVVRNGSTTWTMYLDGSSIGSFNFSDTTSTDFEFGWKTSGEAFSGYLSDFRYVKGTAVYTSNFTPPTSPLTAIAGTEVLLETPVGAGFASDKSGKNVAFTAYNSPTSATQSPFPVATAPLPLFNTSSTDAIVYDSTTSFIRGVNSTGTTVTTLSTSPSGSFTVSFDSPTALASKLTTLTIQSSGHRTS